MLRINSPVHGGLASAKLSENQSPRFLAFVGTRTSANENTPNARTRGILRKVKLPLRGGWRWPRAPQSRALSPVLAKEILETFAINSHCIAQMQVGHSWEKLLPKKGKNEANGERSLGLDAASDIDEREIRLSFDRFFVYSRTCAIRSLCYLNFTVISSVHTLLLKLFLWLAKRERNFVQK